MDSKIMIFAIFLLANYCLIESAPLQYLPAREGFIPVYIRTGDTPLEDINPELAEAFRNAKPLQPAIDRPVDSIRNELDTDGDKKPTLPNFLATDGGFTVPVSVVSFYKPKLNNDFENADQSSNSHIQKIHKG